MKKGKEEQLLYEDGPGEVLLKAFAAVETAFGTTDWFLFILQLFEDGFDLVEFIEREVFDDLGEVAGRGRAFDGVKRVSTRAACVPTTFPCPCRSCRRGVSF